MSGQSIFESEADPRIKWALDLMSEDGVESTSVIGHFAYPVASAASMYLARTIRNHQMRRPVFTGFPVTAALIAGSWFLGAYLRDMMIKKKTEDMAILEHYIRLHPDRFVEPETKKYGDKCVFYEWRRLR